MSVKSMFFVVALVNTVVAGGVMVGAMSREPEDRYGMDEEDWRRFKQQAEDFRTTPAELKAMIDRTLGTPLLFDHKHKVGVTWQAAEDGSVRKIHIVTDSKGPESIIVEYTIGGAAGHSEFMYGYGGDFPERGSGVYWRDLNADGVFDLLAVTTDDQHPLLKLSRGAYIFVEGQWIAARRHETDRELFLTIDGEVPYRFDHASGAWRRE